MNNIIFLPVGSYEQHGKILPSNTDTIICEHICHLVASRFKDSTILPTVTYGLSQEHLGIGKTISLSLNNYAGLIGDIITCLPSSFPECKLIVIINGHGGNQDLLSAVCSQNNYKGIFPKAMVIHVFPESTKNLAIQLLGGFNAHADSVETSIFAVITKSLEDGVYPLSCLGEVKTTKHMLHFFPTRDFSNHGIITTESDIIISKRVGEKLICDSVNSIEYEINKNIKLIEEASYKKS